MECLSSFFSLIATQFCVCCHFFVFLFLFIIPHFPCHPLYNPVIFWFSVCGVSWVFSTVNGWMTFPFMYIFWAKKTFAMALSLSLSLFLSSYFPSIPWSLPPIPIAFFALLLPLLLSSARQCSIRCSLQMMAMNTPRIPARSLAVIKCIIYTQKKHTQFKMKQKRSRDAHHTTHETSKMNHCKTASIKERLFTNKTLQFLLDCYHHHFVLCVHVCWMWILKWAYIVQNCNYCVKLHLGGWGVVFIRLQMKMMKMYAIKMD